MSIKDQIRAEIERMREINKKAFMAEHIRADVFHGRTQAINHLLAFLDSLQQEQPVEGLEEEIDKWVISLQNEPGSKWKQSDIWRTARHFAEWGEKNAYKAIMKKADEVRDKRFDTDYEVKIEPAAGFDLGCVNVYHEGKLVGQYVEPKEEKKLSEGLEEAAWDCVLDNIDVNNPVLLPKYKELLTYLFIAGAEWMKAKMMDDAIEIEVKEDAGGYPYIDATELYDYENDKPLAKAGDKVKVIVIPNTDKK